MQKASLLQPNSSTDSDNSDVEKGKLMKPKKQKKFALGDSDDDDDEDLGGKRPWELFIWGTKSIQNEFFLFNLILSDFFPKLID